MEWKWKWNALPAMQHGMPQSVDFIDGSSTGQATKPRSSDGPRPGSLSLFNRWSRPPPPPTPLMTHTNKTAAKEVRFGVDGRAQMLMGVDKLADAVQVR
jgi:hypothetical protein